MPRHVGNEERCVNTIRWHRFLKSWTRRIRGPAKIDRATFVGYMMARHRAAGVRGSIYVRTP
jgi:hypothetical protein